MVAFVEGADAPNAIDTPYELALNDSFTGRLNATEGADRSDMIALSLLAGQTYSIDFQEFGSVETFAVLGPDGTPVAGMQNLGDVGVAYTPTESGRHFLRVGTQIETELEYGFSLRVEEADDGTTQARVSAAAPYHGAHDFDHDVDHIALDVRAGETYVVSYEGTVQRPYFRLIDAGGAEVSSNQSSISQEPLVFYTPDEDETIYVRTYDRISLVGPYRIEVETEVSDTILTGADVDLSYTNQRLGTYRGDVDYEKDVDWVRVKMTAGLEYQIGYSDTLERGKVAFRAPDGTPLEDLGNLEEGPHVFSFTPDQDGAYFVESNHDVLNGRPSRYDEPQSYDVTVDLLTSLDIARFATPEVDAITFVNEGKPLYLLMGDDFAQGLAADDQMFGHGGDDTLLGGDGDDTLIGNSGDDSVAGGAGADRIFAGADDFGNDVLDGQDGADILGGGAGDDTLTGGAGRDTLYGGGGNDILYTSVSVGAVPEDAPGIAWAGDGDDLVVGGGIGDTLGGGTGNDTLAGHGGDDVFYGGQGDGADRLDGGAGNDIVFAGAGDDVLIGGDGSDTLYNGAGHDTVEDGDGSDVLWGGAGDDMFIGGAGADDFNFAVGNGADTISGFSLEDGDRIGLADLGVTEVFLALQLMIERSDGVVLAANGVSVLFEGLDLAQFEAAEGWLVL